LVRLHAFTLISPACRDSLLLYRRYLSTFNHPEATRGAAIVCPNYLGRWVDEAHISTANERINLPIANFVGAKDTLCVPGHPIYTQMQKAMSLAEAHGYKNVSLVRLEGKGHERLAEEVLAYFASLLQH
jgi:hypothetical protein